MNMIAIDTYEVVQELKAAGFTEAQAEAVTRIVRKAQNIDLSSLATKNDLGLTKADLQRDMAELKLNIAEVMADLHRDLAELRADLQRGLGNIKAEMLKWVISSIGIQTIVLLGAVIALTRTVPN